VDTFTCHGCGDDRFRDGFLCCESLRFCFLQDVLLRAGGLLQQIGELLGFVLIGSDLFDRLQDHRAVCRVQLGRPAIQMHDAVLEDIAGSNGVRNLSQETRVAFRAGLEARHLIRSRDAALKWRYVEFLVDFCCAVTDQQCVLSTHCTDFRQKPETKEHVKTTLEWLETEINLLLLPEE
jgi:hypothetical protein